MEQVIDIEAENKEITRRYRNLLRYAKPILKEGDTKVIRKAFETAVEAHKEQRRKSGEPYIYHPISVAEIAVKEIGLGTTSIVAALLHDVVEDTDTTLADIEKSFGKKVARIIDGLTKISGVIDKNISSQAENFRKMVLSLSDDVRVILVKLADRLHNMRTLESMPRHKQLKIASETIYMYAPLAHRLGLYAIKTELEDLYLKYTQPDTYYEIARKINETKKARNLFIRDFIKPIQKELRNNYLEFVIKGRPKSLYSIWNKMKKQNIPFEEVYDLFAIRIILSGAPKEEKELCWKAYSIVTDHYKPNPDRLRDWISTPKANGYESLHTTVMSHQGKWVEVQIRTERMDEIAEKGYAAHWKYKDKNSPPNAQKNNFLDEWIHKVREMMEQEGGSALDFIDSFRNNLYNEEIFVFTPKGDLKILPRGASALDFSFEVHTEIGFHCMGARVNGKLVPLSHKLHNGDQVEVITSPKQKPSEDWLRIVVTSKARKRIKDHLNEGKKKLIQSGKEELIKKLEKLKIPVNSSNLSRIQSHFKEKDINELYHKIGKGHLDISNINSIRDAVNVLSKRVNTSLSVKDTIAHVKKINSDALIIGKDLSGIDYTLSKCCNPIPGDDVFGFVTVHEGVKIHRTNCPNAAELMSRYGYRVVKARWEQDDKESFLAGVMITGTDRVGLINDITNIIATHESVNIKSIRAETNEGIVEDILMLYVHNRQHLDHVMNKLRQVEGVLTIERFEPENNNL